MLARDVHFRRMAEALAVEETGNHPAHKVGALLHGLDGASKEFTIARPNFWPDILAKKIGREDTKLGNASTTVHAEIAVLCAAPRAEGGALYLTDLPCPNCAKALGEAAVSELYIDSHTHNTPLGIKIRPYFENASLPILECAGIKVFEMDAKTGNIRPLTHPKQRPPTAQTINIIPLGHEKPDRSDFLRMIKQRPEKPENHAVCLAADAIGAYYFLSADPSLSHGLDKDMAEKILSIQDKYTVTIQPVNRLLFACARYGYKILPGYLYSAHTPTAREFVNLLGAEQNELYIGDVARCRDDWGLTALRQLLDAKILKILKI